MRLLVLFVVSVFVITACKSDKIQPVDPNCPEVISFTETIEPLILNNCATSGCHAQGFQPPALTNHNQISSNASDILFRIQQDPTSSLLMPSGGPKLADSLIQQFKCWVNQGKQDN